MICANCWYLHIRNLDSSDFPCLHSLLLGGLHSCDILVDLSKAIGEKLTTLKIETVLSDIPIQTIGRYCKNLIELQVINARVSVSRNHICDEEKDFFPKLKLIYLFLVHYIGAGVGTETLEPPPAISALHCILR